MIKHIILWKLKSEMTAEEKSAAKLEAKTRLESLNGRIDGLVSLRVVTDGLSTSNADMMLDSQFTTTEALAGYQVILKRQDLSARSLRQDSASTLKTDGRL